MSPSLSCLRTDDVDARGEGLGHMLGMADHVHNGDTGLVECVDSFFRGDADGTDEEGGLLFDYDLDKLGELAFGVVVLLGDTAMSEGIDLNEKKKKKKVYVSLSRVPANGWE